MTNQRLRVDNNVMQGKKEGNPTILDEYRSLGVELQLSGVDSQEEAKQQKECEEMQKAKEEAAMMVVYKENLEAAKENADAMGEGMKDMGRALEIARRMMKGDIVPATDERFLMEYNKDTYIGAKNMQALCQNEDSQEQDSVLEEEQEETKGQVESEGDDICIRFETTNI